MNPGLLSLVVVLAIILLVVLRWIHRDWGNAILSALVLPLVGLPITAVAFLAVAFVLGILNSILSGFGLEFSMGTLNVVVTTITALLVLFLGILYGTEQRHLSLIQAGPRLGPPYEVPGPEVFQGYGPKI